MSAHWDELMSIERALWADWSRLSKLSDAASREGDDDRFAMRVYVALDEYFSALRSRIKSREVAS
jgi:hypothetical protein